MTPSVVGCHAQLSLQSFPSYSKAPRNFSHAIRQNTCTSSTSRKRKSVTAHSAHAGKVFPTSDNDAVHLPTSPPRTLPKGKGRGRRKEQVESEIDVSYSSSCAVCTKLWYTIVTAHTACAPHQISLHDGHNTTRMRGDGGGYCAL